MTQLSEAGGEVALRVEGLGKRYEIGALPNASLYDRLGKSIRPRHGGAEDHHPAIWALKDVTFELGSGRVLGVIGRNGSGKSTLMKILARVTAPTEGEAELHGRVGALLQVGTGFHPELTGRDNIALSGAILGMSAQKIADAQDAIIEFSEIEKFIDTAVKHYSSGMYLRLAFSVSAYMDAEIMLIDEVLAVGDAAFQKKCRERIRSLVGAGRTIVFVSHSMASVRELCDQAIVLDKGELVFDGATADAVALYERQILHM